MLIKVVSTYNNLQQ